MNMVEKLSGVGAVESLLSPIGGRAVYFPEPIGLGAYSIGGEVLGSRDSGYNPDLLVEVFQGKFKRDDFLEVLGSVLSGVDKGSSMPKADLLAIVDFRDRNLDMSNKELLKRLKQEKLVGIVFATTAEYYPKDRVAFMMFVKENSVGDFVELVRNNPGLMRKMTHKWAPEFDENPEIRRVEDPGKLVIARLTKKGVEEEELIYRVDVERGMRELKEVILRDYYQPELSLAERLLGQAPYRDWDLNRWADILRQGLDDSESKGRRLRKGEAKVMGRDDFVQSVQEELGESFGLREEEPLMPTDFVELAARLRFGEDPGKVAKRWLAMVIVASNASDQNMEEVMLDTLLVMTNGENIRGRREFVISLGRELSQLVGGKQVMDEVVQAAGYGGKSRVLEDWRRVMTVSESEVGVDDFRVVTALSKYLMDERATDKGREFKVGSEEEAKFVEEFVGRVLRSMPGLSHVLREHEPGDLLVDDGRWDNRGFGLDYEHPIGVYRDLVLLGRIKYKALNYRGLAVNVLLKEMGVRFEEVQGRYKPIEEDRIYAERLERLFLALKAVAAIGEDDRLPNGVIGNEVVRKVFGEYMSVPMWEGGLREEPLSPKEFAEQLTGRVEITCPNDEVVGRCYRQVGLVQQQYVGEIIRGMVNEGGLGGVLSVMNKFN